jgi:hypothetical protein
MTWTPCLPITPVTDDPRPRVVYRTDMLRTLAENSPPYLALVLSFEREPDTSVFRTLSEPAYPLIDPANDC